MITPIRNALGGNAFCSVKEAQDLGAFKYLTIWYTYWRRNAGIC